MNGLMTSDALLEHWQGHRRLTRRTLEAFPEAELFSYLPAPPLRSFAEMMREALEIEPVLRGVATGEWRWETRYEHVKTKEAYLAAWDESNETLLRYWQDVSTKKLLELEADHFFGGPPKTNLARVLYLIDNEIHHRAQGYVYLRLLGRTPPAFYER
ncbi:MAG: DinB family protein [Deinococcota bacterium]|nr:DinB family protein [Deinococcota bacterium]